MSGKWFFSKYGIKKKTKWMANYLVICNSDLFNPKETPGLTLCMAENICGIFACCLMSQ